MADYQINVNCECTHRGGLLYLARPWVWGRPCRRCRRGRNNIIVVAPPPAAQNQPARIVANGSVVASVTPAQTTMQGQQFVEPAQMAYDANLLPPKYDSAVCAH